MVGTPNRLILVHVVLSPRTLANSKNRSGSPRSISPEAIYSTPHNATAGPTSEDGHPVPLRKSGGRGPHVGPVRCRRQGLRPQDAEAPGVRVPQVRPLEGLGPTSSTSPRRPSPPTATPWRTGPGRSTARSEADDSAASRHTGASLWVGRQWKSTSGPCVKSLGVDLSYC